MTDEDAGNLEAQSAGHRGVGALVNNKRDHAQEQKREQGVVVLAEPAVAPDEDGNPDDQPCAKSGHARAGSRRGRVGPWREWR